MGNSGEISAVPIRVRGLDTYRVRLQLERAATAPLNVRLDESGNQGRDHVCELATHVLLNASHRIHNLQLVLALVGYRAPLCEVTDEHPLDFPSLRRLRIANHYGCELRAWAQAPLFRRAPLLQHLILTEVKLESSSISSFLPWANLRSLVFDDCVLTVTNSILQILRTASQLSHLNITLSHEVDPALDHPNQGPVVELPRLRWLDVAQFRYKPD